MFGEFRNYLSEATPKVSMPVLALYVAAIIVVTAYVIFYVILPKPTLQDVLPNPVALRQGHMALASSDVKGILYGNAGSTVAAFVNVAIGDKTPKMSGTHYPILSSAGAFSLEIAPTTIERGATNAQLRVAVSAPTGTQDETIELPNFPLQKWVLVTVLRDGRRFDVMYNDKLVASHRLTYYPATPTMGLQVGDSTLLGTAVHMLVAGERVSPAAIRKERARLADTNGAPITQANVALPTGIGQAAADVIAKFRTVCLPGLPCEAVSEPPANSMKAWSSPYS